MVRVGIDRVGVIVVVVIVTVVVMMVAVPVVVVMIVAVRQPVGMGVGVLRLQPAQAGAERVAQRAVRDVGPRRIGPLPLHVVMVAFLHRADLALEPQHLGAVLAHHA